MNRYPAWMYALVIGIVAIGALLALPNAFGTVPALQVARTDGQALNASMVERFRGHADRGGVRAGGGLPG